jgi:hypothetical protein
MLRCTFCDREYPPEGFYKDPRSGNPRPKCKRCHLLRKYNMTVNDYDEMLIQQQGKCLICGSEEPLVVDHCHDTNVVRGLLCDRCNRFISLVEKSGMLEVVTDYLTKALT